MANPNLLFVGDSLSNGYYASTAAVRWTTRTTIRVNGVENHASATGGPTGTQVSNVLAFYGAGNLPAADVTIIELGTNDFANVSVATFQANYQTLLSKVQSPKIVCLGPWRHAADVAFDSTNVTAWDAAIQAAIAASSFVLGTTATFISLYRLKDMPNMLGLAGHSTYLGGADNFHPNDQGHSAIAQLAARAIDSTWTALSVGSYNGLLDLFQPVYDLNDGQYFNNTSIDLPMPEQVQVRSFTVRAPGETITRAQYKNRTITIKAWLRGKLSDMLTQVRQLETALAGAFDPTPLVLRIALPTSTTYSYADVRTVTHNLSAVTQQILAGVMPQITLTFECAPYFRGNRLTLQNLVHNPGFEAGMGQTLAYTDSFANANNYTTIVGSAPSVASSQLTIPNGTTVTFGSPVWSSVDTWQVRFKWTTSLSAVFYAHRADANNFVRVTATGAIMQLDHRVASVDNVLGGNPACVLTNGNFYWLVYHQWPTTGKLSGATPLMSATIYNDSAGAIGSQVATTGIQTAADPTAGLTGVMGLAASGTGSLVVGGAFSNVNRVQLFGPGGWLFNSSGNGGWGAWDTSTTYTSAPVTSYASGRLDAPPTGSWDLSWRLTRGGAGLGNTSGAIVAGAGVTFGLSAWVMSSGLGASAHTELRVTEYDSSGTQLTTALAVQLTGNQPSWTSLSATYTTTQPTCAYIDVSVEADDSTSGSANGSVWFDNVQVWNQTTTGLTSMPYCELRFPQSPAMLVLTGMVGDAPAPAFIGWTTFLTSWPTSGQLNFAFGKRAQPTAKLQLVKAAGAAADASAATPVLDPTDYGGYHVNYTGTVTPFALVTTAADGVGTYNMLTRVQTSNTGGALANMYARALLVQLPPSSLSTIVYTYYALNALVFTTGAVWLVANTGIVPIPVTPNGTMVDPAHALLQPRGQHADNNGSPGTTSVNWQFLLPIDGGLLAGTLLNPSNGSGISNTWVAGFADGLGAQNGLGVGWSFGLNTTSAITPANGFGGPGNNGSGYPSINPTNDGYLTVDPTQLVNATPVNQIGAYVSDQNSQVLPLHADVSYSPLYLYPR